MGLPWQSKDAKIVRLIQEGSRSRAWSRFFHERPKAGPVLRDSCPKKIFRSRPYGPAARVLGLRRPHMVVTTESSDAPEDMDQVEGLGIERLEVGESGNDAFTMRLRVCPNGCPFCQCLLKRDVLNTTMKSLTFFFLNLLAKEGDTHGNNCISQDQAQKTFLPFVIAET